MPATIRHNHRSDKALDRLEREQCELERQAARILEHLDCLDEGTPEYDETFKQYQRLTSKADHITSKLDDFLVSFS